MSNLKQLVDMRPCVMFHLKWKYRKRCHSCFFVKLTLDGTKSCKTDTKSNGMKKFQKDIHRDSRYRYNKKP